MDMQEIRKRAKELMGGACQLCPVCNGKACAGRVPGMGGVGTGASFTSGVEALSRIKMNMRVIHGAEEPDTATRFLGLDLSLPVIAAPVAGVKLNMGCEAISEEEYISHYLGGSRDAGSIGCFGDAVPDAFFQVGLKALKEVEGFGIPVLKPFEDQYLFPKLEQAAEAGAPMVGMDIDAAGLITPRLMGRPVSPKTPKKLKEIIAHTSLPFILKGIMTPDEALLAVDAGAAGIVVSNHGGRVMDHLPGTAEVLPGIVAAVKGRIAILVDGGIRSGVDILKMLALGADAVMIGRPFAWATLGGGREGVKLYTDSLRNELISAMILTNCPTIPDVGPHVLHQP